jgi:8-oxo-dGTP diphosphatase
LTKTHAQMLPALRATVAAAVITRSGRVLRIRRRVTEGVGVAQLRWQFPAGAIETGEGTEHAAVREAEEETGVRSTALRRLGERVHPTTQRPITYIPHGGIFGPARAYVFGLHMA